MKKRITVIISALLLTLSASAQFEKDKIYIGSSVTGLNLTYSGLEKLSLGAQAQVGYFVAQDLMLYAQCGYNHSGVEGSADQIGAGVGGRYYIEQNGIFLGANCNLVHAYHNYNDIRPGVEVGYAFFLSRTVTIEPAIYYIQSFKKHSDYSTIGLKIGFGIYLFND
ncbi:MAG: hypothetical protein IKS36_06075 [Bacteroidales bacterium]|nr:hypothetical protein [Bacteroidales bacterium]